jgi:hypothetical protein
MISKKTIFRTLFVIFALIFFVICILASFPLIEGIQDWYRYRTSDNLGIGIGIGIIFFGGVPALCISICMYVLSIKQTNDR